MSFDARSFRTSLRVSVAVGAGCVIGLSFWPVLWWCVRYYILGVAISGDEFVSASIFRAKVFLLCVVMGVIIGVFSDTYMKRYLLIRFIGQLLAVSSIPLALVGWLFPSALFDSAQWGFYILAALCLVFGAVVFWLAEYLAGDSYGNPKLI